MTRPPGEITSGRSNYPGSWHDSRVFTEIHEKWELQSLKSFALSLISIPPGKSCVITAWCPLPLVEGTQIPMIDRRQLSCRYGGVTVDYHVIEWTIQPYDPVRKGRRGFLGQILERRVDKVYLRPFPRSWGRVVGRDPWLGRGRGLYRLGIEGIPLELAASTRGGQRCEGTDVNTPTTGVRK